MLLRVVGKVFYNRLVERLDRQRALHEGQAGFRMYKKHMILYGVMACG